MPKLVEQWKKIAQDAKEAAAKVNCGLFDYVIGLEYIISVLRDTKVDTLLRMKLEEDRRKGGDHAASSNSPARGDV